MFIDDNIQDVDLKQIQYKMNNMKKNPFAEVNLNMVRSIRILVKKLDEVIIKVDSLSSSK